MYLLYSLINVAILSAVSSLNYSEFKLLNPSCSPKDSCSSNLRTYITNILDWKFRNCFCDEFCQDYGDCCLDSFFYKGNEQTKHFRSFECVNVEFHGDVYMKSVCKDDWGDNEISQFCKNETIRFSDNRLTNGNIPVTSKSTAITYSNYYCAICNNDSNELMFWETSLQCPSLEKDLEQNSNTQNNSSIEVILDHDRFGIHLQKEGIQEFHECSSVPSFPQSGHSLLRKCLPAISNCEDQWSDAKIKKLCDSYTAVVYSHNETYRNIHCAKCNNIDNEHLYCDPTEDISNKQIMTASSNGAKAFAILFDFFDLYGSNVVGNHCHENEIWDSIFKKCRKIICKNKKYLYKHGKCVENNQGSIYLTTQSNYSDILTTTRSTFVNISPHTHIEKTLIAKTRNTQTSTHTMMSNTISNDNEQMTPSTLTMMSDTISNDNGQMTPKANELIKTQGLNCSQILLGKDEFTMKKNYSIFVKKLQKMYLFNEYRKDGENILVCADDFISYKFSSVMYILSVIGISMSSICLSLHLIAFFSVPNLRSLAGKNLASLSATLLFSYSLFIVSMFSNSMEIFCYVIASLLYYSFLSSFFWMNIISFDIWWTIYRTKFLLVQDGKQSLRFLLYSIYSYGSPIIGLVIALSLDILEPSGFPKDFLPYFGKFLCWFGQRKALLVFFAIPVIVLMILNVIYFSWSIYVIKSTQQLTVNIRRCSLYVNQFKLYTSLSAIMGLTWITGIIAGCIQIEPAWYIFILLNTLQGVFIFVCFTCKKTVWQSFRLGFLFS